jgi:prepilin-type N-terminal cleavage/methylation domain-containing protein
MKTRRLKPLQARAFTLLEVLIALAITAMVISAVYTLAQGTLTLADNVHRAERRDTRKQAFTTFCEHLFSTLPATAALNLKTTQSGGEYLTQLELQNVSSPFDGTPNCIVTLFTQGQAGGGLRLIISCQPISNNPLDKKDAKSGYQVMLFDDLLQCEWRVYVPATQQWATIWTEETNTNNATPIVYQHPPMLELVMTQAGDDSHRQVFWIAPAQALAQLQPAVLPPGQQQPGQAQAPGQANVQLPGPGQVSLQPPGQPAR